MPSSPAPSDGGATEGNCGIRSLEGKEKEKTAAPRELESRGKEEIPSPR